MYAIRPARPLTAEFYHLRIETSYGRATSADLVHWQPQGTAFGVGLPGRFDRQAVWTTHPIPHGDGPHRGAWTGGRRLAGVSRRGRVGAASWSAVGTHRGDGPPGGDPAEGLGHGHPPGATRTEQRLGLGDLGMGGRGRFGGTDAGGEQDGALSRPGYAVVGVGAA